MGRRKLADRRVPAAVLAESPPGGAEHHGRGYSGGRPVRRSRRPPRSRPPWGRGGLVAAREVQAKGRSFYVVEARDRVGGRVLNHGIGNGVSERPLAWT